MRRNKKRINITIDKALLEKAKKKLNFFGGKLSTLFNTYLEDFVDTMNKSPTKAHEEILESIKNLEVRVKKLELQKS